jgi:hypothetical protein
MKSLIASPPLRLSAPSPTGRSVEVRGCDHGRGGHDSLESWLAAALVSGKRLRTPWLEEADAGGLESLPDFIALPRDGDSRPIIPTSRVTALVEARDSWATELGTLDAVTRSITRGQLVMPCVSAPSQQTVSLA